MRNCWYRISCVVILLLFIFNPLSYSQFFSPEIYSPESGLPSRSVFDITQDSSGYLWISTGLGISLYDGYKFNNYSFTDSNRLVQFRFALTDQKNSIWFIPRLIRDPIRIYSNSVWSSIPPPVDVKLLASSSAANIYYENGKPVLALGTTTGLYLYKDSKWSFFSTKNGLQDNYIYNISVQNNLLYVVNGKGISVYNSGTFDNSYFESIKKDFPNPLNIIFKSSPDGISQRTYILDLNKLGYIENNNPNILSSDFQLNFSKDVEAFPLAVDEAGNLFFGSLWGKYLYNSKTKTSQKLYKSSGFASDGAMRIFIDKEHNVWFTDTRGLNKLNSIAFLNFNSSSGLFEDKVSAIAEFGNNNFIFGHNQGLSFLMNGTVKTLPFSKFAHFRNIESRVLDIFNDGNGSLWVAAHYIGVAKIDYNGNISWLNTPDTVAFSSVSKGLNGEILLGTNWGVYTLDNGNLKSYLLPDTFVRKIINFNDGHICYAANGGLYIQSENSVKSFSLPKNFNASNVFAVFKDLVHGILIGTKGGLYTVSGDSLIRFNHNGFNITDEVYAINKDSSGNFWFGTSKNLISWNGNNTSKVYNSKIGLIPGEINRSALLIDSKQRIWIGTELGVSAYNPHFDYFNNPIPRPVFNGIFSNGFKLIPDSGNFNFVSGDNTLKFDIRGLSFINEKGIEYLYTLDGYDTTWHKISQPDLDEIIYHNLPSGDYTFHFKTRNANGNWSNVISSSVITISTPLYFKWWFIAIFFLTFSSILFAFHYNKNQIQHRKILETEVGKRTEELTNAKNELIDLNKNLETIVEERTLKLSESESELRSVFDNAFDGIAIFNFENKSPLKVNKIYLEMLGYTESEFYKLTLYDIVAHEKQNIDNSIAKIYDEENVFLGERQHKKKDGSLIDVEVAVKKIPFAGAPAMLVIVRDITERKKLREDLITINQELTQTIKTKDKFFSILAHDLRNPFVGLIGITDLLKTDIDSLDEEEIVKFAETIHNASTNIFELLNNLLQWGNIQRGAIKINPQLIDAYFSVTNTINLLGSNIKSKNLNVNNLIHKNTQILADSTLLDSIFQNILSNSIKFTPRNGNITFHSQIFQKSTRIFITDSGIGMTPETVNKIFNLENIYTTKGTENEQGTGLGLILCKESLEKFGASINIKSSPGSGTTVILNFLNS